MKNKKVVFGVGVCLLIAIAAIGSVQAKYSPPGPTYTEEWDGRGADSPNCEKLGEGPEGARTEAGWIHWVFSTKGSSTDAVLTLGGTGSGVYGPWEPLGADIWHIYTPYFDLAGLTAVIQLYGGAPGTGSGLVISDYCPGIGEEELIVSKTAVTSFTRTHNWDIEKLVDTEKGYQENGFPKIWLDGPGNEGDETATWTIDVTYQGYEDSDYKVSGEITIENTGDLDAVITSIDDLLSGTAISVDCSVTLPYTLAVGQTLVCTYSEDVSSQITGFNEVTVTTERDEYSADAVEIVWGDPDNEIDKTITVNDFSDLFGQVSFGTVTAPNNAQFQYTKDFAWEDYGRDACGDYIYDNTATIVETEQSASVRLKVNVQCYIYETAYAKGGSAICFIPTFSNWGWTNPIMPGTYTWPLWAGAGQCDTSKGTLVGTVTVVYDDFVTVTYNMDSPYIIDDTHVYAGYDKFPSDKRGRKTVAPGQYYNDSPFDGSSVYVIAHAVVGIPDPDFGP